MKRLALVLVTLISLACFGQVADNNIQADPGWASHAGGNIGGVAPKVYTMTHELSGATLFFVSGSSVPGGYADVDWYVTRPVLANTGHFSLSYDLAVGSQLAANAQAIERDVVLTLLDTPSGKTFTYNFSSQIVVSAGWKLQVSRADNGWVDTGFSIPPLTPGVVHRFFNVYVFDTVNKTYGVEAILVDGVYYPIPTSLQNLPAQQRGWAVGAIFQFQEDLTAAAGEYSELLNRADLMWW